MFLKFSYFPTAGVGTSAAGASFEQQQQFSTFGDIGQTDFEGFQFGMPEFNFQPAEPAQPAQTFDPNNMNNLFNGMSNLCFASNESNVHVIHNSYLVLNHRYGKYEPYTDGVGFRIGSILLWHT